MLTANGTIFDLSSHLDTEIVLVAGDQLWIEAYAAEINGAQISVLGSGAFTWFSGRMIIPL